MQIFESVARPLPQSTSHKQTKNLKLQPVPPPMPSESLSVRLSGISSASNGIGGGTGCNFIFLSLFILVNSATYQGPCSGRKTVTPFTPVQGLGVWNSFVFWIHC